MGVPEVKLFFGASATGAQVVTSTQNQAFSALR